ncbi:MAG: hypothetical protein ABWK00_02065 [Desulfurococcaceae archaeon]
MGAVDGEAVVRLADLVPFDASDGRASLRLYRREEGQWFKEVAERTIEDLLELAGNALTTSPPVSGSYRIAEAEVPGLRVFVGEGEVGAVETVLFPLPAPLLSIKFYKCEGGSCEQVHEFRPGSEAYVYDGYLRLEGVDFDVAVVETTVGERLILRGDLFLPPVKPSRGAERPRRARRRSTRRSKSSKTRSRAKARRKRAKGRSRKGGR